MKTVGTHENNIFSWNKMVIAGLYALIYYSLQKQNGMDATRSSNWNQTPQVHNIRTVSQFKKQQEGGEMCLSGTFQFPMSHFFWERRAKCRGPIIPRQFQGCQISSKIFTEFGNPPIYPAVESESTKRKWNQLTQPSLEHLSSRKWKWQEKVKAMGMSDFLF